MQSKIQGVHDCIHRVSRYTFIFCEQQQQLGGGFKDFICLSFFGETIQFD